MRAQFSSVTVFLYIQSVITEVMMAVSLVGIGVISCVPCFSHFFSLLELQDYRGRFFGHLC